MYYPVSWLSSTVSIWPPNRPSTRRLSLQPAVSGRKQGQFPQGMHLKHYSWINQTPERSEKYLCLFIHPSLMTRLEFLSCITNKSLFRCLSFIQGCRNIYGWNDVLSGMYFKIIWKVGTQMGIKLEWDWPRVDNCWSWVMGQGTHCDDVGGTSLHASGELPWTNLEEELLAWYTF